MTQVFYETTTGGNQHVSRRASRGESRQQTWNSSSCWIHIITVQLWEASCAAPLSSAGQSTVRAAINPTSVCVCPAVKLSPASIIGIALLVFLKLRSWVGIKLSASITFSWMRGWGATKSMILNSVCLFINTLFDPESKETSCDALTQVHCLCFCLCSLFFLSFASFLDDFCFFFPSYVDQQAHV